MTQNNRSRGNNNQQPRRNRRSKSPRANKSTEPTTKAGVIKVGATSDPENTHPNVKDEKDNQTKEIILTMMNEEAKKKEEKAAAKAAAKSASTSPRRDFKELLPDSPVKQRQSAKEEKLNVHDSAPEDVAGEEQASSTFTENPTTRSYELIKSTYIKIKGFHPITNKLFNLSEKIANKSIDIVGKFITLPTSTTSTNLEVLAETILRPTLMKTDNALAPVIGTSATVLKVGPKVYEKISPLINLINKIFPKEVALKIGKWLGDMILNTVLFLEKSKREVSRSKAGVKVAEGETPA